MFELRERETGIVITKVKTMEEGIDLIEALESEDKRMNSYTPNFYELVDAGMTKEEVEVKIYKKMQEIMALAKEYDPDIDYLTLTYIMSKEDKSEHISINNKYWERENKIDFFLNLNEEGGESE